MKTAIVSAANAGFFPFLCELLESIADVRPDDSLDLCILDVGLTGEQRVQLATGGCGCRVARIVEPGWDMDFGKHGLPPAHFRAITARPHLPKYFPEYERFVFLDADTWLQDWRAIEALLHGCRNGAMAVVPELHHSYLSNYHLRPQTRERIHEDYAFCFGKDAADRMITRPVMNSGVWALLKSSGAWAAWAKAMRDGARTRFSNLSEQSALNFAIYSGAMGFYPLPAWCNWICGDSLPAFDLASGRFFTPAIPREPISIIHLNDHKNSTLNIPCTDGSVRHMSLRYSAAAAHRQAS